MQRSIGPLAVGFLAILFLGAAALFDVPTLASRAQLRNVFGGDWCDTCESVDACSNDPMSYCVDDPNSGTSVWVDWTGSWPYVQSGGPAGYYGVSLSQYEPCNVTVGCFSPGCADCGGSNPNLAPMWCLHDEECPAT